MANEIVALQGNLFSVDLQSMSASTGFVWVLTRLPEGIALVRTENLAAPMGVMCGQSTQRFWFGAISETKDKAEIEFTQVRLSHMTTGSKHTVLVTVVPSDSEEFAKYSENDDAALRNLSNIMPPYGYANGGDVVVKYGYPTDPIVKYGFPCCDNDINVKYGYPCGMKDAVQMKYGYPCGNGDINVKYGYPCGVQDATQCCEDPCASQPVAFKYGYPTDPIVKYGFPDTGLKYGYPCGVQDATQCCEDSCATPPVAFKYGYPDLNLKYGFPCNVKNSALAYGYPRVKYGFICDPTKNG